MEGDAEDESEVASGEAPPISVWPAKDASQAGDPAHMAHTISTLPDKATSKAPQAFSRQSPRMCATPSSTPSAEKCVGGRGSDDTDGGMSATATAAGDKDMEQAVTLPPKGREAAPCAIAAARLAPLGMHAGGVVTWTPSATIGQSGGGQPMQAPKGSSRPGPRSGASPSGAPPMEKRCGRTAPHAMNGGMSATTTATGDIDMEQAVTLPAARRGAAPHDIDDARSAPPGMRAGGGCAWTPSAPLVQHGGAQVRALSPWKGLPAALCSTLIGGAVLAVSLFYMEAARTLTWLYKNTDVVSLTVSEEQRTHEGWWLFSQRTDDCASVLETSRYVGPPEGGPLVEGLGCEPPAGTPWDLNDPPLQPFAHMHPFQRMANRTVVPGRYVVTSPVPIWVVELPRGFRLVEVSPVFTAIGKVIGMFILTCGVVCCMLPFVTLGAIAEDEGKE